MSQMDFYGMKRKQLQALCKKLKLPANLTNLKMAESLASVLKVVEGPGPKMRPCLKDSEDVLKRDSGGGANGGEGRKELPKKVIFCLEKDQMYGYIDLVSDSDEGQSTRKGVQTRRSSRAPPESLKTVTRTEGMGPVENTRTTRSRAGKSVGFPIVVQSPVDTKKTKRVAKKKSQHFERDKENERPPPGKNGVCEENGILRRSARHVPKVNAPLVENKTEQPGRNNGRFGKKVSEKASVPESEIPDNIESTGLIEEPRKRSRRNTPKGTVEGETTEVRDVAADDSKQSSKPLNNRMADDEASNHGSENTTEEQSSSEVQEPSMQSNSHPISSSFGVPAAVKIGFIDEVERDDGHHNELTSLLDNRTVVTETESIPMNEEFLSPSTENISISCELAQRTSMLRWLGKSMLGEKHPLSGSEGQNEASKKSKREASEKLCKERQVSIEEVVAAKARLVHSENGVFSAAGQEESPEKTGTGVVGLSRSQNSPIHWKPKTPSEKEEEHHSVSIKSLEQTDNIFVKEMTNYSAEIAVASKHPLTQVVEVNEEQSTANDLKPISLSGSVIEEPTAKTEADSQVTFPTVGEMKELTQTASKEPCGLSIEENKYPNRPYISSLKTDLNVDIEQPTWLEENEQLESSRISGKLDMKEVMSSKGLFPFHCAAEQGYPKTPETHLGLGDESEDLKVIFHGHKEHQKTQIDDNHLAELDEESMVLSESGRTGLDHGELQHSTGVHSNHFEKINSFSEQTHEELQNSALVHTHRFKQTNVFATKSFEGDGEKLNVNITSNLEVVEVSSNDVVEESVKFLDYMKMKPVTENFESEEQLEQLLGSGQVELKGCPSVAQERLGFCDIDAEEISEKMLLNSDRKLSREPIDTVAEATENREADEKNFINGACEVASHSNVHAIGDTRDDIFAPSITSPTTEQYCQDEGSQYGIGKPFFSAEPNEEGEIPLVHQSEPSLNLEEEEVSINNSAEPTSVEGDITLQEASEEPMKSRLMMYCKFDDDVPVKEDGICWAFIGHPQKEKEETLGVEFIGPIAPQDTTDIKYGEIKQEVLFVENKAIYDEELENAKNSAVDLKCDDCKEVITRLSTETNSGKNACVEIPAHEEMISRHSDEESFSDCEKEETMVSENIPEDGLSPIHSDDVFIKEELREAEFNKNENATYSAEAENIMKNQGCSGTSKGQLDCNLSAHGVGEECKDSDGLKQVQALHEGLEIEENEEPKVAAIEEMEDHQVNHDAQVMCAGEDSVENYHAVAGEMALVYKDDADNTNAKRKDLCAACKLDNGIAVEDALEEVLYKNTNFLHGDKNMNQEKEGFLFFEEGVMEKEDYFCFEEGIMEKEDYVCVDLEESGKGPVTVLTADQHGETQNHDKNTSLLMFYSEASTNSKHQLKKMNLLHQSPSESLQLTKKNCSKVENKPLKVVENLKHWPITNEMKENTPAVKKERPDSVKVEKFTAPSSRRRPLKDLQHSRK